MSACIECVGGSHHACPFVSAGEEQLAEEEGYVSVDMSCCCGHYWTTERMTLAGEYASYAREVTERYGYGQNTGGAS